MKRKICAKCLIENHRFGEVKDIVVGDESSKWIVRKYNCNKEECENSIIYFVWGRFGYNSKLKDVSPDQIEREIIVLTRRNNRKPLEEGIPSVYLTDYQDSFSLVESNPKLSILKSTQCLKNLLAEKGGFKSREYFEVIQIAIESESLPSELINGLVSMKNIENLSKMNSKISDEERDILMQAEAEWKIEMVEKFFNFFFINQPIDVEMQLCEN
jgi:hypothetical protein